MNSRPLSRIMLSVAIVAWPFGAASAQITSNTGDGVLNAPYRGTINSLRGGSSDVPYGEVQSWVEPTGTLEIDSTSNIRAWHDAAQGDPWDRSVLRLYHEFDAAGTEINLSYNTSWETAELLPNESVLRLSLKAIGTKTLASKTFKIVFNYRLDGGSYHDYTREFVVAPTTGSFCELPGESEAFHYGTPVLDVSVGAARLVVPIGQTADCIGAAYSARENKLGPLQVLDAYNVLLPGAAETIWLQDASQFRLFAGDPAKPDWGTPWPGYLRGFYCRDNAVTPADEQSDAFGPDGTHYDSEDDPTWHYNFNGSRQFHRIRPLGQGPSDAPTQVRTFSGSANSRKVTRISDQASPATWIDLNRDTGGVVRVTTSDGRGWNIEYDEDEGDYITAVIPDGGNGARYFTWSARLQNSGRVTEVRNANQDIMYRFTYTAAQNGDLLTEERFIEDDGGSQLRTVIEHVEVSEGLRQRKEYFGTGVNDFRQFDFEYDSDATPPLNHRLKSITSYAQPGGLGDSYTTTYTHDVDNADGTMAITDVDLPDDTDIHYDYSPVSENFGFRTKTTHTGPNDGSLVTYDVDYEFFYTDGGTRLFYVPRMVTQRDGRGTMSEITFDYEDGGQDENGDGMDGERSNQLFSRTGPTITLGTSGSRIPETRYTYDATDRVLTRQETDYASGLFRAVEFGHDELLRRTSQTVDPGGENLATQYQYFDNVITQDRITIDADNYYTKQTFDNDGRLLTTQRFLTAGGTGGNFYQVENEYDTNGRLYRQKVDNKDQDGNPISGETNPIVTEHTYDRLGRLTLRTFDPGGIGHIGQEANFDYNWMGDLEREYDTSGRGTVRVHDGRGLIDSETPLALGETPDMDLTTTFEYDELGRRTFTYPPSYPDGPREERVYDDFGRLEHIKRHPGADGGNLITTTYEYDNANNVIRTYVDEATVGVLSDSTDLYDEGGFNYEFRQRTDADTNGANDPLIQRKFDWAGNVTEGRTLGDATVADRVITTIYDGANRVDTVQDSEGGETVYVRDDRGNVTEQTVKLNASDSAVTTTVYDALSRPTRITDPEDSASQRPGRTWRCDSRGNLRRATARTAADTPVMRTVYAYDAAGRQTRRAVLADASSAIEAAAADVTTDGVVDLQYDADGRLEVRTTYNNNSAVLLETVTTYDDLGRVDRVTDPSGSYTDGDYGTDGRLTERRVFDGVGVRTFTFEYDGHDRLTSQTALGSPNLTTSFALDGLGRQIGLTDPKGIMTETFYDLVGRRVMQVEDFAGALQRETQFIHNCLSQLIGQIATNKDSGGGVLPDQTTTYRYDTLGRQTRAVYPDSDDHGDPENCSDCVQVEYDLAGRMTQRTDQRGLLTTLVYDNRGLLLTRTADADLDTFDYDAAGRMTLAERGTTSNPDAVSASVMAYTDLGDLDYETQTIAGGTTRQVDYAHDQAGNRIALTYPSGEVLAYVPTVINQVDTITLNGSPFVDYDYNGRLLDTRRTTTDDPGGNTVYEYQVGYDDHRRIDGITNSLETPARGVETVADYSFTHDDNGNPLSQAAAGMPGFATDDRTFSVDRLDRLTGTGYAETGTTEESTLDLIGNRESQTDRAGTTTAYGPVNPANEYADVGGQAVSYDEAGNLTVDEDGRQYLYDEHNRLIQVKAADETVLANYTYDALGRRILFEDPVAGVTTRYCYDGQRVVEERDGSDTRTRYLVNGAQYIDERIATYADSTPKRQGTGFTYYLMNQNHSIAGTGNADGSVIERLDYSSGGDFGGGEPQPPQEYFFDADEDGDIDLADYADFHSCFLGPGVDGGSECDLHDWEGDYDIDAADFAGLAVCFSGDGGTPPQQCLLSEGPCHAFYFDADFDGDIDLADHTGFTGCLAGPDVDRIDTCSMHDVDADYDIDLADHAAFAVCFSGDGLAPPHECCQPTRYYHDADADGDVDLGDWASFTTCFEPGVEGSPFCVYAHDFDDSQTADGQIDLSDHAGFWSCFQGPRTPPPASCARDVNPTKGSRQDDEPPPSGTFAFHGRPIDVLSDGHVLIYIRARYYDPKHGRWLQRDPTGYTDGGNLYESFAGNSVTNTDPMGTGLGATGDITTWQEDEATAKIEIWSNPPGWWHKSQRMHNVATFVLALGRDVHARGDPAARVWVTLGDRRYLVNLQSFRHWVTSGIHTELSTGLWGTADPSLRYLSVVLARSFLEHFRDQIYGILDLTTGKYLLGYDPDAPENICQSRTALQSGVRQAGAMIELGFRDVMYAFTAAALTEAVVQGVRFARASRGGRLVPANVPAPPPTRAGKTPPNPWGKLGSPGHRAKVREVAAELKRRGWTIVAGGGSLPERMVSGTAGTPRRFPDITARKGGRILHVQVGKKTKGGLPVARERDRLSDIRKLQEPGEHTVYIEWP